MSSSHRKEAPISEPLPCPDCGTAMVTVVETCRLADGLTVKRLRHYRCRSCGARFFDDAAMHRIQQQRPSIPQRHGRRVKPVIQSHTQNPLAVELDSAYQIVPDAELAANLNKDARSLQRRRQIAAPGVQKGSGAFLPAHFARKDSRPLYTPHLDTSLVSECHERGH